jgi:hypothetical protein
MQEQQPQQQPVMQPQGQPTYGEPQPQPAGQPQPGVQPQPVMQPTEEPSAQQGRGIEYGAHLLVPIFLTNPVTRVRVDDATTREGDVDAGLGLGIHGRIGWEFGAGFSIEANVGGLFSTVSGTIVDDGSSFDPQLTLLSFWLGAGARFAILNPSAFVPFVGVGAGVHFWDFCKDGDSTCESNSISVAVNGVVGFAYEISPFAAIEAGLQTNVAFPGDAFTETEVYLMPFAGGTLYY